jgi:hypothetical protein
MQNAGDHPSVIHPPRARLVLRQVRLDRCPRLVRQPEQRNLAPPIIHTRHESGKPARLKPLIEFEPWCPSNLKFAYEFATERAELRVRDTGLRRLFPKDARALLKTAQDHDVPLCSWSTNVTNQQWHARRRAQLMAKFAAGSEARQSQFRHPPPVLFAEVLLAPGASRCRASA